MSLKAAKQSKAAVCSIKAAHRSRLGITNCKRPIMPFLLLLFLCLPALFLTPASAGAADLGLIWDASEDAGLVRGYRVYYGEESGNYSSSADAAGTTCTITNLSAGTTYYFAVVAIDLSLDENESDYSNEIVYTVPAQAGGGGAAAGGGGGGGGGGGCFIATAAFGSYLDPHVLVLRSFRDRFLLGNRLGRSFVAWYYRTSPPYADALRNNAFLKTIVRIALLPLVGYAYFCMTYGLMPTLLIALAVLAGMAAWARRKLLASERLRHFDSH